MTLSENFSLSLSFRSLRARSYLSGEVSDVIEKHRGDSMTRRSEAGVSPSMRGKSIRWSNVMWSNVMHTFYTRSVHEEGAIV